jgi:ABC-type cobalamin transport system permease subunit
VIRLATIYWVGVAVILAVIISFTGCVAPTHTQAVTAQRQIDQVQTLATDAVSKFVPSPAKEIANTGIALGAAIASLFVGAGAYTHSRRTRSRSGGNRSAGTVGKIL